MSAIGTGPAAGTSRPRRATVKDVARAAGVGIGTVSRVLNDDTAVSDAARDRVRAAIEALGYVRDHAARDLRAGRSRTVGLLVENVADPFYSHLQRALEHALEGGDRALLAASAGGSATRRRRLLEEFASRRIEGLVVTMPLDADESGIAALAREGVHVVLVDRPALTFEADSVMTDSRSGARAAVAHLLARGHRRVVAMLDDDRHFTARERRRGAQDAVDAADDAALLAYHDGADDAVVLDRLRGELASPHPPTAVFSGNSRTTVATLRALRRLGSRLDHVGFDDLELADLLDPPLTVVAQDPAAIGRSAARMLLDRVGGWDGPARAELIDARLVVRS
ncbi:LacI family DNA-binding transcriptional regulator [Litorihabitans aurantiacus]|uniref:LacI family transcriptional regulator n=1 Tax=Litorihabitans aurantiacus TaxID=1930061 RepID=A0AA38CVL2_9MICO|nr:LacI family DNA-binding transcriptional regulator [Litorihabitans aurantiacus]GMA30028.1 LacI family transcriptional regulator [Litorihabitans aurantiacus]GMA33474.1 LacI family transcriptional regulator [Litorihabitans aurantiacus]